MRGSALRPAAFLVAGLFVAAPLVAQEPGSEAAIVLDGATLVDGTGAAPVADAQVVVRGDRIACAGGEEECPAPEGARSLDLEGRWIVPGLVDAHVHFSQTGWVDGRPDAVDLRDRHPYPEVVAELESNPGRFLRAYLCSGVTSVFDVGGYPWTWTLRERVADDPTAPRVEAAGPLLSTVDFWLNLPGERQFVYMASDSIVRRAVRYHAANHTDAVKVWYITPPQPPDSSRARVLVRAAAEEAEARGIPLIVHATGLWEAKDAVRAGADLLVHSVFDEPVDEEFLRLARESGVLYTPTIMVLEGYADVYRNRFDGSRYPLSCVDPQTRALVNKPLPEARLPRGADTPRAAAAREERLERTLENTRRVHEAGIPIVVGTDAGNPGTLHGPSIHREIELVARAGLTPMETIVAATRNGARAMGREADLGTVEAGKRADLLVLSADPLADPAHLREIVWVMKGGALHSAEDLRPADRR
ncbi:MAG: amidohydrolase family protein [Gemmatimonadota bacterium]|nr:amidohydrolase family protein [Gemmatimonadota bacterium]